MPEEVKEKISATLRERHTPLPEGTISRATLLEAIEARHRASEKLAHLRNERWRVRLVQFACLVAIAFFTFQTLNVWGVIDVWRG